MPINIGPGLLPDRKPARIDTQETSHLAGYLAILAVRGANDPELIVSGCYLTDIRLDPDLVSEVIKSVIKYSGGRTEDQVRVVRKFHHEGGQCGLIEMEKGLTLMKIHPPKPATQGQEEQGESASEAARRKLEALFK